ncbi:hypothetical protein BDR26DRAFT_865376 [Obelidium mucronatum]|nr:hypothetical protein BDR26DRAFT_865376 [Obelidium mucronatum]
MPKRHIDCATAPPPTATIHVGTIIHSLSLGRLEVIERGAIVVSGQGSIAAVEDLAQTPLDSLKTKFPEASVCDAGKKLIVPGFVDAHCHAPQYSFVGTGMELPLLDWLNKYTFRVSPASKTRSMPENTTKLQYLGSLPTEQLQPPTLQLFIWNPRKPWSMLFKKLDNSKRQLSQSKIHGNLFHMFLRSEIPLYSLLLHLALCHLHSSKLMTALADISAEYDPKIRVQSHLSENKNEINWVGEMHPDCESYSEVYNQHGLLHDRSYMAHCIWCNQGERDLLRDKGVGVVHCPNSNFSLSSGSLNVRRMLNEGLKVGLGSDVAGGYSPSMLDAIRQAITASKMVSIGQASDADELSSPTINGIASSKQYEALSYAEAFHLATMGGAECLSLGDTVGNFLVGKEFDALIIDPLVEGSPVDVFDGDSTIEVFQRFLFLGDDRNIEKVYVKGRNRKLATK